MNISFHWRRIVSTGLMCAVGLLWSGCESCKPGKPGPPSAYNIGVILDDSLKDSQDMLVDLVAVNPASFPSWESYSMTDYWKGGGKVDLKRKDAADKVTFDFSTAKILTNGLSLTDEHWKNWLARGATRVIVLANTPGAHTDKAGSQDARRQIIELDRCHWPKKTTTVNLRVQRSGIEILTPPRSAAK